MCRLANPKGKPEPMTIGIDPNADQRIRSTGRLSRRRLLAASLAAPLVIHGWQRPAAAQDGEPIAIATTTGMIADLAAEHRRRPRRGRLADGAGRRPAPLQAERRRHPHAGGRRRHLLQRARAGRAHDRHPGRDRPLRHADRPRRGGHPRGSSCASRPSSPASTTPTSGSTSPSGRWPRSASRTSWPPSTPASDADVPGEPRRLPGRARRAARLRAGADWRASRRSSAC